MNLNNVNIFSRNNVERLSCLIDRDTPMARDIVTFFKAWGENTTVIEYPCFGGQFANLFNHLHGINKLKQYRAIDYRNNFTNRITLKDKKFTAKTRDILTDRTFKPHHIDVLLSVGYLDNVVDPIGFINDLQAKVVAENVFIVFDIAPKGEGQDLKKENTNVKTLFTPAGKFVKNLYSEEAVKEIAKAVGLECRFLHSYSTSEAMLYKMNVVEQPSTKRNEEPPKKDTKKKSSTKKKTNNKK